MNANAEFRQRLQQKVLDQADRLKEFIRKYQPAAVIQRFIEWQPDPIHEKSDDYQAAIAAWREFQLKDGVDYSEALEFARQAFQKCETIDETNDAKAHSIIQYHSGGTAIVALGAPFAAKYDTFGNLTVSMGMLIGLLPSFLCAAAAVWNAVSVRQPQASRGLPPVTHAYEMADHYEAKEKIGPLLWLVLHPMVEAAVIRNANKAKILDAAHKYYKLAIACLAIPFSSLLLTLPIAYLTTPIKPADNPSLKADVGNPQKLQERPDAKRGDAK